MNSMMNPSDVMKPGDVIISEMGGYQHWSIVSDRFGLDGNYMLISASKRTGTVREEPWDDVVGERRFWVDAASDRHSGLRAVERARKQIGVWSYSVTMRNCEHFANFARDLCVSSKQVKGVMACAGMGMTLAAMSNHKVSFGMIMAAGAIAGLGLYFSGRRKGGQLYQSV